MKKFRNLIILSILSLAAGAIAIQLSCSGSSSTGYGGGGGGGGALEFDSGDLSTGGGSFSHVFKSAKVVPYYCRHHGGRGGVGMSGVVTVTAGGTPSKINVSITTSTLPDLNIDVMDTVVWTNNSSLIHTVTSDN